MSLIKHLLHCRIRKLPKGLKEWQAFLDLQKKIDDFNECCPLLELMANKAMKPRHWDRISAITGHTFDLESEAFALKNIMDAPLLTYKEDIEVIFSYVQYRHTWICQASWYKLIETKFLCLFSAL